MKLSLPLTGLLCAGMLLTSAASAAELTGTLKRIQHSGTMTLGYREASVPFSYLQADGTPTGYGFEVCKAVSEAVKKELNMPNLTIKYQAVTSANRIPLIQNGTVDIAAPRRTPRPVSAKPASASTTSAFRSLPPCGRTPVSTPSRI